MFMRKMLLGLITNLFLFIFSNANAAIGYVVANKYLSATATSATSVSKAVASNVTAGSLLVAIAYFTNVDEVQTFSDNNGNTWHTEIKAYDSTLAQGIAIGWAANANAGATTIADTSASTINRYIIIAELTGAATTTPVDGTAIAASGSSSAPSPGAITTAGAGIVIGAATVTPTTPPTPGTGFTAQFNQTWAQYPMTIEDQITTASGSYTASYTTSESFWAAMAIAFKAGAGGPPPGVPSRFFLSDARAANSVERAIALLR